MVSECNLIFMNVHVYVQDIIFSFKHFTKIYHPIDHKFAFCFIPCTMTWEDKLYLLSGKQLWGWLI